MEDIKVYFEVTGFSGRNFAGNNDPNDWLLIDVYVNPTGDGHAYKYNISGSLYQFAWCNHLKAKCVLSSELPEDMWYSIKHGADNFRLPTDGYSSLKNEDIDIEKLVYDKVDPKEVELYNIAKEAMPNIHTIEDFKAFYPQIKDARIIPREVVEKVIKLAKQAPPSVVNGEIGIANLYASFQYSAIIRAWGL